MYYNKLLENIVLPLGELITGYVLTKTLKKYRLYSSLSDKELHILQEEKMKKILEYSSTKIPFYSERVNGNVSDSPYKEIKKFPIIDKPIIKTNLDKILVYDKKGLVCAKSSGSSGVQGEVYMSVKEYSMVLGILILIWEWAGYKIGNSLIQTGITPNRGIVKSVKDFLFNIDYTIAFGTNESVVLKKLKELQTRPRTHFAGYASSIHIYGKIAEKYNIDDIHFKSIISFGDKMFSHYKKLLEKQFHTKVFDTYGSSEGFVIAAQYDLEYYYIMSPHVYVEILDDDGYEVKDGELGNVVVTSLDNYTMPLIRYKLGDLAVKLPRSEYPKNRKLGFPLLKQIVGRDTDIVKTQSGKFMIVHFFTGIFEHISEIQQFQVIQKDLESMEIKFIPCEGFTLEILNSIRSQIHKHLEEEFEINFVEVNEIKPSPSGKPQIIKSFLK